MATSDPLPRLRCTLLTAERNTPLVGPFYHPLGEAIPKLLVKLEMAKASPHATAVGINKLIVIVQLLRDPSRDHVGDQLDMDHHLLDESGAQASKRAVAGTKVEKGEEDPDIVTVEFVFEKLKVAENFPLRTDGQRNVALEVRIETLVEDDRDEPEVIARGRAQGFALRRALPKVCLPRCSRSLGHSF